jgi:hypothetical protein
MAGDLPNISTGSAKRPDKLEFHSLPEDYRVTQLPTMVLGLIINASPRPRDSPRLYNMTDFSEQSD